MFRDPDADQGSHKCARVTTEPRPTGFFHHLRGFSQHNPTLQTFGDGFIIKSLNVTVERGIQQHWQQHWSQSPLGKANRLLGSDGVTLITVT